MAQMGQASTSPQSSIDPRGGIVASGHAGPPSHGHAPGAAPNSTNPGVIGARVVSAVTDIVSWGWMLLVLTIVVNVALRYLFSSGRVELEELQWHLYAVGFIFGLSYAVQTDSNVRVDILSQRFSERTRAIIEIAGYLVFVVPFVVLVIYFSLPFIRDSFEVGEGSPSPGGLPYRWVLKAMLPAAFCLLLLSVIGRLLVCLENVRSLRRAEGGMNV